jgi:hypothetical protein
MRGSRTWVVAVGLVATVAVSCSQGGADAEPAGAPDLGTIAEVDTHPMASTLEPTVRAYNVALFGGDAPAVFTARSLRCRRFEPLERLQVTVEKATATWGGVAMVHYEEDFVAGVGRPTYEMADPSLNQRRERWIVEEGAWRNDDCPGVPQE